MELFKFIGLLVLFLLGGITNCAHDGGHAFRHQPVSPNSPTDLTPMEPAKVRESSDWKTRKDRQEKDLHEGRYSPNP